MTNPNPQIKQKYLNLKELSVLTGRPLSTLRRWAWERRFPLYRMSNRIIVSLEEFESWLRTEGK